MPSRLDQQQLDSYFQQVITDGFCVLRNFFSRDKLQRWSNAFRPLLQKHIETQGDMQNRGSGRYYVTLPFAEPFADVEFFDNDDLLAIVHRLVGSDAIFVQLATDTPLRGSDYQKIHRDAPPLFPEWGRETPPFQLAVNFPLVDVTPENGPFEVARGTHMLSKEEGMRKLESGEVKLEPILLQLGDVMIRDVRGLHRGTPNHTDVPRPMVVIGYSRRWLFRPEVSLHVPRATLETLSQRARHMVRFNPVVESVDQAPEVEVYQSYAY
jgi:ectoine hydroxylase-related dioxygenase (phytanoyl-CoA dioxygenase family)